MIEWISEKLFMSLFDFIFNFIFFNLGYLMLKILTLTAFPKNREDAKKKDTEIALFAIIIFILSNVIFVRYGS